MLMRSCRTALIAVCFALTAAGCESDGHEAGHDHGAESDVKADTHVDACGGEDVDTFDPLPSRSGDHFTVTLVSATPAIPDKGDNTWELAIEHGGAALTGATVTVKPWMPAHGHGTNPETFAATPAAQDGRYSVGPFNLLMPGYWTVTVTIDDGQGTSEEVVFGVCVEG